MPDENGTEATGSGAPGADESPFTDAADNAPCAVVEKETTQDSQSAADAGDKPDTEAQADPPKDLKVVVSIKGDGLPSACSGPRLTRISSLSAPQTCPGSSARSRQ